MYGLPSPLQRQKKLYKLAASQSGYFTAKQASALGYASNKRIYHVRAGNWIRERRGIYRIARFPEPDRPDLILWMLWSRDRSDQPKGVFSHQTALSLHELTDANPAKLDLTVPARFRRGTPIRNPAWPEPKQGTNPKSWSPFNNAPKGLWILPETHCTKTFLPGSVMILLDRF